MKEIVDYDEYSKKPFLHEYGIAISLIAINKNIRDDINKVYKAHESKCYNLAKKDFYYDSALFKMGDIEYEECCKKLLGVSLLSLQDEKVDILLVDIIMKEWIHVYNLIKNKDVVDMGEMICKCYNLDESFYEGLVNCYIAYIYACIMGKSIVKNEGYFIFKDYIVGSLIRSLEQDDNIKYKVIPNENLSNLFKKNVDILKGS